MKTAELRVVKVAETRFVLDQSEGHPWQIWETDTENDAQKLVEFAGRLCYQSWQKPNPATRRNEDYVDHILESKHFSVIEHAGFTVAVIGCSRAFSHEAVRHRHLSFSQLSQRFFDESDAAAVIPSLYRDDPDARAVLEEVYQFTLDAYKRLVEIGTRRLAGMKDKTHRRKRVREAARVVLPNMTEVHIVISGNHRAWREFFEKRGDIHADPEIREVAVKIFKEVAQPLAPAIYQDMAVEEVPLDTGEVWEAIRRKEPEPAHLQ